MKSGYKYLRVTVLIFPLLCLIYPAGVRAAQCNFTKDLKNGSVGNEVKCLQQYLNSTGYLISNSGAGASGKETTTFYGRTATAVAKWQKDHGLPSTGTFGPLSRAKYLSLNNAVAAVVAGVNNAANTVLSASELQAKIGAILAQINQLKDKRAELQSDNSKNQVDSKNSLSEAQAEIDSAQSQVDQAYKDGKSVDSPNEYLKDARTKLKEANRAYKDARYADSSTLTDEVFDLVDRALVKIGITNTSKSESRDKINEAKAAVQSAESKVNQEAANGKATDNSETILSKADSKYDSAKTAFENRDYGGAINLANEAISLADDAVDAIGESATTDTKNAINVAITALNNAINGLAGSNYGNINSYLNNAKSAINEAKGSLLGDQYLSAQDYLTSARDRVTDARNYLNDAKYPSVKSATEDALKELNHALNKL